MLSKPCKRAQVSVETIVALIVVFVFFLVVLGYNSLLSDGSITAAQTVKTGSECLKLSEIITNIYASGNGSSAQYSLETNAIIFSTKRIISLGGNYCSFLANTFDYNLTAGEVTLTNSNGRVIIFQ